jgi:hypothetical protein
MNSEDFEDIFEQQVTRCREVLTAKAKEYAQDYDRLHNFKVAGQFIQGTPEQALWGFLVKHLVSLSDMIPTSSSNEGYSTDLWDEKIGDSINYLILLRALVYDMAPMPKSLQGNHHAPDITRTFNDIIPS